MTLARFVSACFFAAALFAAFREPWWVAAMLATAGALILLEDE